MLPSMNRVLLCGAAIAALAQVPLFAQEVQPGTAGTQAGGNVETPPNQTSRDRGDGAAARGVAAGRADEHRRGDRPAIAAVKHFRC